MRWSKRKLDNNTTGIYFGSKFIGYITYDGNKYYGNHIIEGELESRWTFDEVYYWFKMFQGDK